MPYMQRWLVKRLAIREEENQGITLDYKVSEGYRTRTIHKNEHINECRHKKREKSRSEKEEGRS